MRILLNAYSLLEGKKRLPLGNFNHALNLSIEMYKIIGENFFVLTDDNSFNIFSKYIPKEHILTLGPAKIGYKKILFKEIKLPKILRKYKIDIIYSIDQLPFRKLKCKTIVNIADLDHFMSVNSKILKRIYKKISYLRTISIANHITCPSYYTLHNLQKFYGISDKIISVIPHGTQGIEILSFEIAKSINSKYWITFGHQKHKNCESAIGAIKSLNTKLNNPQKLVIIGESDYIQRHLKPFVHLNNLSSIVLFTGFIEKESLYGLIMNAEGLLYLSLSEGFGLPVIDAMKLGCPVIVSNKCALPEIVGDAGIVCEPFDIFDIAEKMRLLTEDNSIRKTLIDAGLRRASMFSWQKTAREIINIIENLLLVK